MSTKKLKAYYFKNKFYSSRGSNHCSIGVVATTKKDAIEHLGEFEIQEYLKSKIETKEFEITSVSKEVYRQNKFNMLTKEHCFAFFYDVEASVSWKMKSDRTYESLNLQIADDDRTKVALSAVYDEMFLKVEGM